jgi:hypothetical protein
MGLFIGAGIFFILCVVNEKRENLLVCSLCLTANVPAEGNSDLQTACIQLSGKAWRKGRKM